MEIDMKAEKNTFLLTQALEEKRNKIKELEDKVMKLEEENERIRKLYATECYYKDSKISQLQRELDITMERFLFKESFNQNLESRYESNMFTH